MNQLNNNTHDNFTCPVCGYSVATAVRAGLPLGSLEAVWQLVSVLGVRVFPRKENGRDSCLFLLQLGVVRHSEALSRL